MRIAWHFSRVGSKPGRLLKLHGDLHHPNRLVVTEEDYDAFLTSLPLLATHLSSLLIDHTAFFIGYSLVAEVIELADLNVLDLARSRRVEQEVLDLLDEPITR